jgi:hypothetical protein
MQNRQQDVGQKQEAAKVQESVFESVFKESYVPFEALFNETYLGARPVLDPSGNKSKNHLQQDGDE